MADTPTLGIEVQKVRVILTPDANFHGVLRRQDGTSFTPGTAISLRFATGQTFNAVVAGTDATFDEEETAVQPILDAIAAGGEKKAKLFYELGTDDIQWARCPVVIQQ